MQNRELPPLVLKAKNYGIKCHADTNHFYGKIHPYKYHLTMVYGTAIRFIHLIPEEMRDKVLAACWVHDVIEDARQTYNDVKTELGEDVAEIAYALTSLRGKTRKERANQEYYSLIGKTPGAAFVKICDRIANYEYSKGTGGSMYGKYSKEMPEFFDQLYKIEYDEMFQYILKELYTGTEFDYLKIKS